MDTLNLNKEWNFITQEINAGNKGGTRKGEMLFEFQILLPAFLKTKSPKERQILTSIFQKRKRQYKNR